MPQGARMVNGIRTGKRLRGDSGLLLATVGALLISACGGDPAANPPPPPQTLAVATTVVTAGDIPLIYTTTGSVVSDERVEISSRTPAYVRTIEVREGQRVELKQLLATLDSQDIDANIRAAQANRDQAGAAQRDARKDVEDAAKLFAKGVLPEATLRKARLQLQLASDNLAAAEAALSRARAERQYTQIRSPVAGVVVARHGRVGDLAAPGKPLITVESDTALLFATQVPERRVASIRSGDSVQISIDALGQTPSGETLTGEVVRVVASGNPVTRGFEVKVSLPATPGLLPGMFGRARFTIGSRNALVVPATALVERGGLTGVYVVADDGRTRFRWLRTEHRVGAGTVVLAGLDAGERIVTAPTGKMREGDRVALATP